MNASILVVEDEALIADDIIQTLAALGFGIAGTARTGEEALVLAERERPALALLDIKLAGELTGIDVARRVRETLGLPVVFLTSHSDDATIQAATLTAPHGYLVKPFTDRELKSTIEVALARHRVEAQLAARERWLATTLNSMGDAVVATDAAEAITFINPAAEQITGWSAGDALGKRFDEVLRLDRTPEPRGRGTPGAEAAVVAREVPAGPEPAVELITRSGERRLVEDSTAAIRDERDEVVGRVVVLHDVTTQRTLSERQTHTDRLASIGTMAAGLMHEINNPLAYALNNNEWALEQLRHHADGAGAPAIAEILSALEETADGMDRVRRLVADLRRFGRGEAGTRTIVDLAEFVEPAVRMIRGNHHGAVDVRWERGGAPLVEANAGQLTQVIVNLLTNAIDASGGGNTTSPPVVEVKSGATAEGSVFVEIHDRGSGIAAEVLPRIFDPFFTTKPIGEGMGLGLSICHRIVTDHGGQLTVRSAPGRGTTFFLHLPAALRAPIVRGRVSASPPPLFRVLVIDDEPAIGRILARQLRPHMVVIEQDADVALGRLEGGERFDAILCDAHLPRMEGPAFHAAVARYDASQAERIVFMIGGARRQQETRLGELPNAVVDKPFVSDAGVRAIEAAAQRRVK